MNLTFIYLSPFVADCKRLGLKDEDLQSLEAALLANPEIGSTVDGAGGVRKMRFAPPSWHVGKRGATRIIYAVVPTVANAYFLIAHGKNEQGELEAAEKKACRELMIEIKRYLGVRL